MLESWIGPKYHAEEERHILHIYRGTREIGQVWHHEVRVDLEEWYGSGWRYTDGPEKTCVTRIEAVLRLIEAYEQGQA